MPWPMVHFAIASELISEPSPELLLGSLAPDSIHVRTNLRTERQKPTSCQRREGLQQMKNLKLF